MLNLYIKLLLSLSMLAHPLHLSLTNIDFQSDKNQFQITFKIFWDDLEAVILQNENVVLNLGQDNENVATDSLITYYVKANFELMINNKKRDIGQLQKREMNHEAIWLYYETDTPRKIKKVTIKNNLMNDFFMDQSNLLIFKYMKTEKAFQLDIDKTEVEIVIN